MSHPWGLLGPFLVIFGIGVAPMTWSRHGKTGILDKFKAGHRTHKEGEVREGGATICAKLAQNCV